MAHQTMSASEHGLNRQTIKELYRSPRAVCWRRDYARKMKRHFVYIRSKTEAPSKRGQACTATDCICMKNPNPSSPANSLVFHVVDTLCS